LTQAIEQEVEKCPEAQRLQTHPGVGALTALAFVLIIGRVSGRADVTRRFHHLRRVTGEIAI
jgi:transposase